MSRVTQLKLVCHWESSLFLFHIQASNRVDKLLIHLFLKGCSQTRTRSSTISKTCNSPQARTKGSTLKVLRDNNRFWICSTFLFKTSLSCGIKKSLSFIHLLSALRESMHTPLYPCMRSRATSRGLTRKHFSSHSTISKSHISSIWQQ